MILGGPGGKRDAYTYLRFEPLVADIEVIKKQWDEIAALLPDRGVQLQPSVSGGSEEFRKEYASERGDVEAQSLQRALDTGDFEPSTERSMRDRIETLTK